mmetsp:Transcript_85192/g.187059  ORF Transcript_85192/g.187059 Transcript_85192/m.187059 type:complete len:99 (-) Transcript_85192:111-407(-)
MSIQASKENDTRCPSWGLSPPVRMKDASLPPRVAYVAFVPFDTPNAAHLLTARRLRAEVSFGNPLTCKGEFPTKVAVFTSKVLHMRATSDVPPCHPRR